MEISNKGILKNIAFICLSLIIIILVIVTGSLFTVYGLNFLTANPSEQTHQIVPSS